MSTPGNKCDSEWPLAVHSAEDWDRVLDLVLGFHDGIVREFAFREDAYVEPSLWLTEGRGVGPSVSVIVQFQRNEVPAAELFFEGVESLCFARDTEVDPGTAVLNGDRWIFEFLTCRVEARTCVCKPLDSSYLGSAPVFACTNAVGP
jgi:hypothetical protein